MIAAPFLGELGWEVALWAPWLRWMMNNHYEGRDITVMCRQGHEYLYEDFATKTMTFACGKPVVVDCQNAWIDGSRLQKQDYHTIAAVAMGKRIVSKDTFTPHDLQVSWNVNSPPYVPKRAEYFKYGEGAGRVGVAVHARMCQVKQPERNWVHYKWAALAEALGGNIASVGSKDESIHIAGTEDLRGIPIKELCNLFAASKVVVGPSSGPLALAMLCGTPVVWWSPNSKDISRFNRYWNPFQTPTARAAESWDPDVIEVEAACQEYL